jgi:hypothetical protein
MSLTSVKKIADSWPASIDAEARKDWDGNMNLIWKQ